MTRILKRNVTFKQKTVGISTKSREPEAFILKIDEWIFSLRRMLSLTSSRSHENETVSCQNLSRRFHVEVVQDRKEIHKKA